MFNLKDHRKFYKPLNLYFKDLKKLNLSFSAPDFIKFVLQASKNLEYVEEIEMCYLKSMSYNYSYISIPKLYHDFFPETVGKVKKVVIISMESEENTKLLQNAIPKNLQYDLQVRKSSDSDIPFKT